MSDRYTICEHGSQKHKCEACQFRDERDDALARIAELEAENRLLTETGQLNVLADIREIVDPMSPGRMMQSELVERIREIVAENARLAAIVEKLPKTADGVAIVPEQEYFAICDEDEPRIRRVVYVGNCKPWIDFEWSTAETERGGGNEEYGVIGVYSTEAAALAAKERQR